MNYKNIFAAIALCLALTSCGLYKKYENPLSSPGGDTNALIDIEASPRGGLEGVALAQMSWREFFTDPLLQQLIEQALANNTNLASARITVEQSEASLKAARLGYLPEFGFAPQGALSSFDHSPVTKTYSLPLQMSWDVELFGSITNK